MLSYDAERSNVYSILGFLDYESDKYMSTQAQLEVRMTIQMLWVNCMMNDPTIPPFESTTNQ